MHPPRNGKNHWQIFSSFVAFSEYLNFTRYLIDLYFFIHRHRHLTTLHAKILEFLWPKPLVKINFDGAFWYVWLIFIIYLLVMSPSQAGLRHSLSSAWLGFPFLSAQKFYFSSKISQIFFLIFPGFSRLDTLVTLFLVFSVVKTFPTKCDWSGSNIGKSKNN